MGGAPSLVFVAALFLIADVNSFQRTSVAPNRPLFSRLNAIPVPLSNPPTTFLNCVKQAVVGAKKALETGERLLEIEFPPLPLEYLEDSSSSARDVSDANTRWAIEFAKSFTDTLGQVTILYPDDAELQDAIKYVDMEGGDKPFPNMLMATARADSIKNAKSIDQVILSIFGATGQPTTKNPTSREKLFVNHDVILYDSWRHRRTRPRHENVHCHYI